MPSSRFEEARDYGFADQVLALRKRARLTQRELATLLQVNARSIHGWESGLFYPEAEHLQRLIALYLERGVLAAGREEAEAEALWAMVRAKAARRTAPFDRAWFARLPRGWDVRRVPSSRLPKATSLARQDWGDGQMVPMLRGRNQELATLAHWVREEQYRVVQVLGPGGIGKTVLATRLAQEVAPEFMVVHWRSLRNAPPVEEWLAGAITTLSAAQILPPEGFEALLGLMLALLREHRALLVLDNLESVLEPEAPALRYRAGYEGYGEALRRLGESVHHGCLVLTSREQLVRDDEMAVRSLRVRGLSVEDCRALLESRRLAGDAATWQTLVERYAGNPLALSVVAETIAVVFGGEIATFLAQEAVVFGDIWQLLDEQVTRLSPIERSIGTWLAVEREPVGFAELVADLGPGVARDAVVEALEALARRSLLERGAGGAFTLQPVVLEYATTRLVERVCEQVLGGEPALLVSHALVKARTKDYVRRSQERLIGQPLLEQLRTCLGSAVAVERQLLTLLEVWRGRGAEEQGYGPGNVVNLLRLLRGDLRGLDLSRLAIRQAYLAEVEAQDASLAGTHLAEVVLAEAFDFPTAVALSADGAILVAGTPSGEVRLWRAADRTLLLAVRHPGGVWGVALSGDGGLVATGGVDGTVTLWEAPSGRARATLQGPTGVVYGVTLSGDGRLLASGSWDGTVRLWHAASGQLLATLEGHTGVVYSVALSRDGHILASGSWDGTVRLWHAASGQLLATLEGHTGAVRGVALSTDGCLLASGSEDGTAKLWEVESGQLLATLQGHTELVRGVTLSGDGRLLAIGGVDGTLMVWEVGSRQLLATLQGHSDVVYGVALSGDGRLLASGSVDGTVRLWEARSGQPLATLQGHNPAVYGVALSGEGRLVASGSFDGTVRLWEGDSGRPLVTLQGHTGVVRGVALSGDGQLLASGGWDGTVRLWEATPGTRSAGGGSPGRPLATLHGHTGVVYGVALSGNGHILASGGWDGTVRLWDVPGGRALATFDGHAGVVYSVALSGDGRLVASGSEDGRVRLWEIGSGQPLATIQGHSGGVMGVALSGDGRLLASGGLDGTVRLWEATPGTSSAGGESQGQSLATLQGHTGVVYGVALSEDGHILASGSWDGTVRLWEAPGGRALATFDGHAGVVYSVALNRDGGLLVSARDDGTIRLWEAGSGACLRTLRSDRRYERLNISGLTGVTDAQSVALLALGARDAETAPGIAAAPGQASSSQAAAAAMVSVPPPAPAPVPPITDRPPTNVRTVRTTFVGRSTDLAALTQALDPTMRSGTRLLTLTGVAGSGKTRLALAVAEALRDAYRGGVWLVDLSPLPASAGADLTPVVAATLAALYLHEQVGQEMLDTLIAYLRSRRLLLVLDNCEHLLAASAMLTARLLDSCPELTILATSQQALGQADETVWPVAPLAVPPQPVDALVPEALPLLEQSDAVQLFVQRAQATQPRFALTPQNAATVVAICRRLDGLPLAIELAAARLNVLPVEDLLTRLDDRFQVLRRSRHTSTNRHQTLQATMDWSYGLLDPAAQAVLRRLAVFAGGWDLAAAEAVCAGANVEAGAVLELLDELLDRSLVYVHEAGRLLRYGMLETVRHYGLQQLEHADERAVLQDLHLQWCVTLAEQAAPALQGPEQVTWLERLAREHDNLRAALQWALDRGLSTRGLRVAGGLGKFWLRSGHQREGWQWLVALLALAADDDAAGMAVRAAALESAAWLADDRHDFGQAAALFAQSGALRRALGEEEQPSGPLINAAMEARSAGDYARAAMLLEESLAQYRRRGRTGDGDLGLALSWGYRYTLLALVLREQGQYARASALCEECLALARERGDAESIGVALLNQADLARDEGDTGRVRLLCEECLARFRDLGHPWAIGFALNNLALAAYLKGDLALAARHAEESAALFRGLQAGPSLAEVLVTVGRIRGAQGEAAAARTALAEALNLAGEKGPRLVVAAALEEIGMQAMRQGCIAWGVQLLASATALRQAMGAPVRPADRPAIEDTLAAADAALGDTAFTDAWATGHSLPVEQIVSRALAALEDRTVPDDGTPQRKAPG